MWRVLRQEFYEDRGMLAHSSTHRELGYFEMATFKEKKPGGPFDSPQCASHRDTDEDEPLAGGQLFAKEWLAISQDRTCAPVPL